MITLITHENIIRLFRICHIFNCESLKIPHSVQQIEQSHIIALDVIYVLCWSPASPPKNTWHDGRKQSYSLPEELND